MLYYALKVCLNDDEILLHLEYIVMVHYIIINGSIHGKTISIAYYNFSMLAPFFPLALSLCFLMVLTYFMYFRSGN